MGGGQGWVAENGAWQVKAGIPTDVGEHMAEHSKDLSKQRKKRVMPTGLASAQDIEAFSLISSHPLHKTTKVGYVSLLS